MEAVKVGEDEVALVDPLRCIGCGVCTSTCPTGATGLVRRDIVKPPLGIEEVFTLRMGGK